MQLIVEKHISHIAVGHDCLGVQRPDLQINSGEAERWHPDKRVEVVGRAIVDHPNVVLALWHREELDQRVDLQASCQHVTLLDDLFGTHMRAHS